MKQLNTDNRQEQTSQQLREKSAFINQVASFAEYMQKEFIEPSDGDMGLIICAADHTYDKASNERKGVSIYDICLQYMPQMSEPQFGHADDGTFTYEQEMRLVPMPFEPDKGPDYWKEECLRLKERMLELINDKEE